MFVCVWLVGSSVCMCVVSGGSVCMCVASGQYAVWDIVSVCMCVVSGQ